MGEMAKRVAAVIIQNGKVLVLSRVKIGREYFVFPGGGVKLGETLTDALRRELQEELGLTVTIERPLFELENRYGMQPDEPARIEHYFLIRSFSGTPAIGGEEAARSSEANQYEPAWVSGETIGELKQLEPELARRRVAAMFASPSARPGRLHRPRRTAVEQEIRRFLTLFGAAAIIAIGTLIIALAVYFGVVERYHRYIPPTSIHGVPESYKRLVDDLRRIGAEVKPVDEVYQPFLRVSINNRTPVDEIVQPFLSVRAIVIRVNEGNVQVFPLGGKTQSAMRAISPDGKWIGRYQIRWGATPHFYARAGLVVLYVGDGAKVIRPLVAVLGPQFAGGISSLEPERTMATTTLAANDLSAKAGKAEQVSFITIASGTAATGPGQAELRIIRNDSAWAMTWSLVYHGVVPQPPIPKVNFTTSTILAIFAGEHRTGGSSGIAVTRILDDERTLRVLTHETVPGQGCIVTQALAYPYQVVQIPKLSRRIRFERKTSIVPCR